MTLVERTAEELLLEELLLVLVRTALLLELERVALPELEEEERTALLELLELLERVALLLERVALLLELLLERVALPEELLELERTELPEPELLELLERVAVPELLRVSCEELEAELLLAGLEVLLETALEDLVEELEEERVALEELLLVLEERVELEDELLVERVAEPLVRVCAAISGAVSMDMARITEAA